MRKALLSAYSSGNQAQSTVSERPYDRTRAASYSPGLGIAATRLRACGDPKPGDWNNVVIELQKMLWQRFTRSQVMPHKDRANVCKLAIAMWFYPKCAECRGAGEARTPDGLLLAICPQCNGVGVRKFRDAEIAQTLGRVLNPLENETLHAALTYLIDHENQTTYNAAASLEREIPDGPWKATDGVRDTYLAQLSKAA